MLGSDLCGKVNASLGWPVKNPWARFADLLFRVRFLYIESRGNERILCQRNNENQKKRRKVVNHLIAKCKSLKFNELWTSFNYLM